MVLRGNFLGAAIVDIIYTVYILFNPLQSHTGNVIALVVLNTLLIILMYFAFRDSTGQKR